MTAIPSPRERRGHAGHRIWWMPMLALALVFSPTGSDAAGPRLLPPGQLPADARLGPLKDLDGYFPFTPPTSREAWDKRAERVRRQMLVALGLWPLPTRTPLNAVIHGRIDCGEYTVEKVFFESLPGLYVTGNLYRPQGRAGKVPGVLFAHGHWQDARLSFAGEDELRREIANGEERFEEGGRSRFQSMCVQLARMGCVVWQWDMLSDSDAVQFSRELVHGFKKQRPEMNAPENWGLYSPQAESHLQSIMGLQTWNAIRSLDFLLSLPEVDPERVAMTGASGGGTQTFILAALDARLKLSFPAVMVSTAMQGGCTCENACLLRIGTGNVEFAALFAPKPQGMTTANDWTKEMATKGFPELKALYKLLGAPDNVLLHRGEHFPHNYNAVSRSAFYTWLNRHFKLGFKAPVIERDYRPLSRDQLTVWTAEHPAPRQRGDDFERQLLRWLTADAARQLAEAAKSRDTFQQVVGRAVQVVIGRTLEDTGEVAVQLRERSDRGAHWEITGLVRNVTHGEELPAVLLRPKQWNRQLVIWASPEGKAGLFTGPADGPYQPRPHIQKLLDAGAAVAGVDLLYQGEFLADGQPLTRTRRVKNPREAAAYTFGYNYAVFAQRVHDLLTVLKASRSAEDPADQVCLVGLSGAGPWVAAARAAAGGAVDRAVVDTQGFRFGQVRDLHDPNFLPGGAKYFDLPGLLALNAPGPLFLAGEGPEAPAVVTEAYRAANATDRLRLFAGEPAHTAEAAVTWLLGR